MTSLSCPLCARIAVLDRMAEGKAVDLAAPLTEADRDYIGWRAKHPRAEQGRAIGDCALCKL